MIIPDDIMELLIDLYSLEEIDDWFDTAQIGLQGETPCAVLSRGEFDRVRKMLETPHS